MNTPHCAFVPFSDRLRRMPVWLFFLIACFCLSVVFAGDASSETVAAAASASEQEQEQPAAEKAAEELRQQREQERQALMRDAESFVQTADQKVERTLPYPINLLFSVRLFGITLWRIVAGCGLVVLGLFLIFLVGRRFRDIVRNERNEEKRSAWNQVLDVATLALRHPLKVLLAGLFLRAVSNLVVTLYHPDFVWLSNVLIFLSVIYYLYELVGSIDTVYGDRLFHGSERLMETVRPIVVKIIRFFILLFAGVHIYQAVTGQTLFSLLAGLGIGGVALALASQETLKNVFGFASIAMDKSFLVGDSVTVGDFTGTIEHVGLRSTRLRGFDGNAIVIPNTTVIGSNIVNSNRRPYIRREIRIALSPANPYEKIEMAMEALREAVGKHEGKVAGLPPVVRFVEYEPARIIIQVLFWYDANMPFYPDESSRVNLLVFRRLSELDVLFAER